MRELNVQLIMCFALPFCCDIRSRLRQPDIVSRLLRPVRDPR